MATNEVGAMMAMEIMANDPREYGHPNWFRPTPMQIQARAGRARVIVQYAERIAARAGHSVHIAHARERARWYADNNRRLIDQALRDAERSTHTG